MTIEVIAFDADDTLWHSESLFHATQARLSEILDRHAPHDEVQARLHDTEAHNIRLFGYGVKGFTLSMVEAAIEISRQQISADEIHEIVMMGKAMLDNPLELMDGVEAVLEQLRGSHRLFLITKGDHMDQYNKIGKSGLSHRFEQIEVVLEKDVATYRELFARHDVAPERLLMVGNSVPSDILPILELGGHAVHIPYHVTASFERHDADPAHPRFRRLERIAELPALLAGL